MARHWWGLLLIFLAAIAIIALCLFAATAWGQERTLAFPEPEATRLLQELDERDQLKAEVEALKSLVDRYEALSQTDKKLLEAQDQLLQIKDRIIQAQNEEVDVWKKRAESERPDLLARMGKAGKTGGWAAAGAGVGLLFPPAGPLIGAAVGAVLGELF